MDSTSGERFKVVFYGQLDDKKEKSLIQDSLVKKLKMSEKAATNLLKCSTAIVKKNLPESSARKYIAAFENVGVFLELEPMSVVESSQVDSKNAPVEETKGETKLSLVAVEDTQEVAATEAREDSAEDGDSEPEEELEFKFDGNGFEYFKIWIVNIVLTILTLGIYSAWAKVRNQQYFYGHTELTGTRFEYLAKPINILIGRLLVVPVVIAGNFLSEINPVFALVFLVFILLAMPWVFYRSLRFNHRNTAFRNIKFDFTGSYWGAAAVIYGWPLLSALTFGLLAPLSAKKTHMYIANHSKYGQTEFSCDPPTKDYYVLGAIFIAAIAVGYGIGVGLGYIFEPLVGLGVMLGYVIAFSVWTAGTTNLYFNNAMLGEHEFSADYEAPGLIKLYLTNTIGMVCTLGFFYPWARVRVAKYKAEHTYLTFDGNMDDFVNSEMKAKSSIGEELGDALGVDVAAF